MTLPLLRLGQLPEQPQEELKNRGGNKISQGELKAMQAWDFEEKLFATQIRIADWHSRQNGNVCVSFSGGKDSTVLLHLVRSLLPEVEAVFVDTGLEFPEVRKFARSQENVTVLKPKMNFIEILDKYGWCFPSKDVAMVIHYARKGSAWAIKRLAGQNKDGSDSYWKRSHYSKWASLVNAPFKISHMCCEVMKEKPLDEYGKQTGKKPFVGTMAIESARRTPAWLKTGCNAFEAKRPMSKPLSFWTKQDILYYIKLNKLEIASVYGEIVENSKGQLSTTGEKRTGCMFCPVGCHLDKTNRYQRMKLTHPKIWNYCMNSLGLKDFLEYIGVDYGGQQ
jgi:3'-phosphoadenosine 5'-phosphosulfate sulfotransferase (PAPS reductase)/FAD synthetase